MRRRLARRFLLVLVLLGLAGVGVQVYLNTQEQEEQAFERSDLEGMLPEAVQWIQNFRRIQIRQGKKTWEIEGAEAQYLREDGTILVREPRATFYLENSREVRIRGDEGTVILRDNDLQEVTLRDNVKLRLGNYVVDASRVKYQRKEKRVYVPGLVRIHGERIDVEGQDMVVFVDESMVRLRRRVKVTLQPTEPGDTSES